MRSGELFTISVADDRFASECNKLAFLYIKVKPDERGWSSQGMDVDGDGVRVTYNSCVVCVEDKARINDIGESALAFWAS